MFISIARSSMRTLLLCAVLAIGITSASELRPDSSKRYLFIAPLSDAQKNQIDEGFKAATFIADKLDAKNIAGIAGQLIGKVSSYLGAIGPFVGLALSLFGGPSAELTAIKQLYTRMEGRFDHIDNQFSALRKQVAFVATQVHFTDIESNINAVHTALISLSRTTDLTKYKYEARAFKRIYDNTYESAGIKLYQGITTGGALTGGLFQEYMTFSSYDRGLTANFMGGTLNLLMRAAALEMTYAEITNDPSAARKKQDWVTRFGEIKDKMLAIDRAIVQQYHTQMTTDVNTFATDNPKSDMSNRDFANKLNTMITKKVCKLHRVVIVWFQCLYEEIIHEL